VSARPPAAAQSAARSAAAAADPTAAKAGLLPAGRAPVASRRPSHLPTPRLFKRLRFLSAILMAVATVLGVAAMSLPAASLTSYCHATEQAERLVSLQASLAEADAQASTAVLGSGQAAAAAAKFATAMDAVYTDLLRAGGEQDNIITVAAGIRAYEDDIEALLLLLADGTAVQTAGDSLDTARRRLWDTLEPALATDPGTASAASPLLVLAIVAAGASGLFWLAVMTVTAKRTHRLFNLWHIAALLATAGLVIIVSTVTAFTNNEITAHADQAAETRAAYAAVAAAWRVQAADALRTIDPARPADEAEAALATARNSVAAQPGLFEAEALISKIATLHSELASGQASAGETADRLAVDPATGQPPSLWDQLKDVAAVSAANTAASRAAHNGDAAMMAWMALTAAAGFAGLFFGQIGFRARLAEFL
jgi:hypothetical protein